jgi:FAD/FMN-containing dehydrogenase/Fe-S oxidoreductase
MRSTTERPLHGPVDVDGLRRALENRPDVESHFDEGTRAMYATDASNYRQVPIGVVMPRTVDALEPIVAACRAFDAPITPRGGGTALAGQSCNVAVIVDISKYLRKIEKIDTERRLATVEPGVVLDELRDEAKKFGLTFAPDPSTHVSNTIGGMIGNNSCGVHSLLMPRGRTEDCVEALEVLTYEGERFWVGRTDDAEFERIQTAGGRRAEIYRGLKSLIDRHRSDIRSRYPDIPRRISGYNFPALLPEAGFDVAKALVGTEGTCVLVLRAVVRLVHNPSKRALAVMGFPDIYEAADRIPRILEFGPVGLEAIDDRLVDLLRAKKKHIQEANELPNGRGFLLAEFGADDEEDARAQADRMLKGLRDSGSRPDVKIVTDMSQQKKFWAVRESGLAVTADQPNGKLAWEGWEDSAVHPNVLGAYLRDLDRLYDAYGLEGQRYGHFGQGCVHTRITFDLQSDEGVARYRAFIGEAANLVVRYGGSLSGEHGDGQSRGELLDVMFGPELVNAFREFKRLWDPRGRMNPGKKVDPARMTDHLRIHETYRPHQPWKTQFRYPDDRFDFNRVTVRCVGIGKCRKIGRGVMCPSFMATQEEKYTTRGRARLLYEMAQNGAIPEGWRSDYVRDSLDLCLSCKGCKGECPVNVDMATYKAEFFYHHYKGRIRPRAAYSLGLSYKWLPWGSRFAGAVNALSQWGPTAHVLKAMGGIHPDRPLPKVQRPSYRARFERRDAGRGTSEKTVVLWPDSWNNYLHPEILEAAEDVLRRLGYSVLIPERTLCCGRPLYDFGMLDRARKLLERTLDVLSGPIAAGTPVVVLEPSCLSVFKEELPNLLVDDPRSQALQKISVSLSDLVDRSGLPLPKLGGRAVVQPHCHEASVLGTDSMQRVFGQLGVDAEILDAGCCGMAGSFGMEKHKYDVSLKIADRGLLPKVRERPPGAMVVADGFSCREQIRDLAEIYPLHTAQVLRRAFEATLAFGESPTPVARSARARSSAPVRSAAAPGPPR